jgi:broad specificity phosphatase PhoE
MLVRHAERAKAQGESALRPEGRERAKALVDALGNMGVTAIYSPDRGRNRETVQPLADRLGLSVILISEDRLFNTREFANKFVEEVLSQHAGGVVVWVGNKSPVGIWGGNLQEIYKRLGGIDRAPSKYDDLFIMVVTDTGELKVRETTYGEKAGKFDQ